MSRPIIKVAKPGSSIIGLDAKDFALNTKYLLPKIYRQITVTEDTLLDNDLGYPHGSWTFRRLDEDSFYGKLYTTGGIWDPSLYWSGDIYNELFTGDQYTFFSVASQGTISGGTTITDSEIDIRILEYLDAGATKSDPSLSAALFAESLTGVSNDIALPSRPNICVGVEGEDLSETNLSEQFLNTKLNTLKIFKTGLLTLSLPEETLVYHADSVVHTSSFVHGLGYPPMYFPPATINMRLGAGVPSSPVTIEGVNDPGFNTGTGSVDVYVDSDKLYLRSIRASYGDDAFGTPGGDLDYPAITIKLYYTIFYNDITEEFNLLT